MIDKKTKVLFVGVFDPNSKSTNNSQIIALNKIGCDVVGYNYRQKAQEMGSEARDAHLENVVKNGNFDLVLYSKCNAVSFKTFKYIRSLTKTCLWFMDPLVTYDDEMREKTKLVDYAFFDKKNVLKEAKEYNKNSFYACEGFDSFIDKPRKNPDKEYDITFIGNIYGNRLSYINQIKKGVLNFNGVFGYEHSEIVSKSKINLNFCTDNGASDRVYKILAARGFLISDDWEGREEQFKHEKDLIICNSIDDFNEKINLYLNDETARNEIAHNGHQTVQKYSRINWAKKIIENYEKIK